MRPQHDTNNIIQSLRQKLANEMIHLVLGKSSKKNSAGGGMTAPTILLYREINRSPDRENPRTLVPLSEPPLVVRASTRALGPPHA
jgi:hypothetical protein